MLRSIGADHVIDYTKEDFTKNGKMYDVIIDTFAKSPFSGSLIDKASRSRTIEEWQSGNST
jgi:NADPH:quinone reductase-like Zn-dependent oxidoreductase